MPGIMNLSGIMNAMIPISRFNRGEAGHIFSEVRRGGARIVVKNNSPECVLLSPEEYERLLEQAENYALLMEAEKRMSATDMENSISHEELMKKYGISEDELPDDEMEFE